MRSSSCSFGDSNLQYPEEYFEDDDNEMEATELNTLMSSASNKQPVEIYTIIPFRNMENRKGPKWSLEVHLKKGRELAPANFTIKDRSER